MFHYCFSSELLGANVQGAFLPNHYIVLPAGAPNEMNEGKVHGHNVLRISHLFGKLSSVLKHNQRQVSGGNRFALENYANAFGPCCGNALEASDEDVELSSGSMRRLNCDDLVFLWGFRNGSSARELKRRLSRCHESFSEDFDVKLVDKNCAAVAFCRPGLSGAFLDAINSDGTGHKGLREMMSEGLRVTNYATYKRVCEMGIWNSDLADSLDQAVSSTDQLHIDNHARSPYEIWWDDNTVINLDEL
uniref:Poly(A)-specific ribonuclease n=1 Tax=Opuntia streptacantha TaxID=393608 RepID=A0A7C9AQ85_OPUST